MAAGGSTKPIVFVFGAHKDDADGRKRNLSAINTAVAYRAHEQRRAKKSKQRAQVAVKENANDCKTEPVHAAVKSSSDDHKPRREPQFIFHEYGTDESVAARSSPKQAAVAPLKQRLSHTDTTPSAVVIKQEYDEFSESSDTPDSGGRGADVLSTPSTSEPQLTPKTESGTSISSLKLNSYFETTLDPFFRLPEAVTTQERWMVHYYFREMGHIGFGTHQAAMFCPDRDWVSAYVCSKALCLQWLIIHAQEHLTSNGILVSKGAPDKHATALISRKAKAYNALSHALKTARQDLDRALTGIMFAAILDFKNTSMHLAALDKLLESSGGFEGFLNRPVGTVKPEHIATVYTFGECPISTLDEVRCVRERLLNNVCRIYARTQRVRNHLRQLRNKRPWDSRSRAQVDSNGTLVPSTEDEHIRYYVKAQSDSLIHECIAGLINHPYNSRDAFVMQARHFALLVQIHTILLEFDEQDQERSEEDEGGGPRMYWASATFHRRLQHVTLRSTARDGRTGNALLTSGGLLLVNSFVRQEVQTYVDRGQVVAKGVRVSQAIVDAIKTFTLLGDDSRVVMVEWLRDALRLEEEHHDGRAVALTQDALGQMSSEIERNWLMKQMKTLGRG